MSPLTQYLKLCESQINEDPSQRQALEALDKLYHEFMTPKSDSKSVATINGVYLWGDVGRGKTFLMDLFCQAVKEGQGKAVLRLHFHRFMAMVHQKLNQTSGKPDPLVYIGKQIASEYSLICFDEFFVADIGDAIILGRLFDSLFNAGVVLVATSNIPILELYKNGLQRDRFLPTISLLQRFVEEIHLSGQVDHRLNALDTHQAPSVLADVHQLPSSYPADIAFKRLCDHYADASKLSSGVSQSRALTVQPLDSATNTRANTINSGIHSININININISICNREVPIKGCHGTVAWFDFASLCQGPRSALDYIELAGRFSHILLSDVPALGGQVRSWIRARGTEDGALATQTGERQLSYASEDDPVRRFISLVDELYDQKVMLVLNSQCDLANLYLEGALAFEFRRTYSRLMEMRQWQ
jgi:cell division protein ZapE